MIHSLINSLVRVRLIAGNTFLEAVRQKFFNALLLISVALVFSSHFFQQFDFGTGELKFITDFGFGALFFFGSILAVTSTAQLFFNEIDNRTALTMLAKPIFKLEFIAGKLLGAWLLMAVFVALLSLVLAGILYWRESALMLNASEAFVDGRLVRYGDIAVFALLQWVKFGMIAGISLLVASFAQTNLYTVVVSFFVLLVCQLQYIALEAYAGIESAFASLLVRGLAMVFPNFQLFNVGDQLVYDVETVLPLVTVCKITLYGLFYMLFFLGLAQLNFRRREI